MPFKKRFRDMDKRQQDRHNKIDDFTKEEKLSGGAVFEAGVRQSKEHKAIRRIAEPLMEKHWKDKVTNLHRIYKCTYIKEVNKMIEDILKELRELRDEMVQANWPAQRLSNIILKYEMKLQENKRSIPQKN